MLIFVKTVLNLTRRHFWRLSAVKDFLRCSLQMFKNLLQISLIFTILSHLNYSPWTERRYGLCMSLFLKSHLSQKNNILDTDIRFMSQVHEKKSLFESGRTKSIFLFEHFHRLEICVNKWLQYESSLLPTKNLWIIHLMPLIGSLCAWNCTAWFIFDCQYLTKPLWSPVTIQLSLWDQTIARTDTVCA